MKNFTPTGVGSIQHMISYYFDDSSGDDPSEFFRDETLESLAGVSLPSSELKSYTDWAFQTGKDRVDAIVSNTHRGAYEREVREVVASSGLLRAYSHGV